MTFKIRLLSALVVLLCFTGIASAQMTYYVNDGVGDCPAQDFTDIQSAINATLPGNGDTVIVCPGLYEGALTINHDLTLQAETPADINFTENPAVNAIITGGAASPPLYLVRINSSDVTVDGFEMLNRHYLTVADPFVDPSLVLVGTWASPHVDNVHITNNLLHEAANFGIPATNGAQGVNWNNASGSIVGNAIYAIFTGDLKGRGIWLSTNQAADPVTIPSQNVLVQNNFFTFLNSYAIGAARMNGVDIIGNEVDMAALGNYGAWFKLSANFEISDNLFYGYNGSGIVITVDNPADFVSTDFMIHGNSFTNAGSDSSALVLVPGDRITFTENFISNLGSDGNTSYAATLGFDFGFTSIFANDNYVCDNFNADDGDSTVVAGDISFNPGGLNNAFPGGEAFPGNRGCVIDVLVDLRPGTDSNHVNTRAKQLVPIAVLTTPEFDACNNIDPETVEVRGTQPSRFECKDVDADGDLDGVLSFRARNFTPKPTAAECSDPNATIELTGLTFDLTPIRGSDFVSWRGPDCK